MIPKLALLSCLVALPAFCAGQSAVAVQALPDAAEASSPVHSDTQTAPAQSPSTAFAVQRTGRTGGETSSSDAPRSRDAGY